MVPQESKDNSNKLRNNRLVLPSVRMLQQLQPRADGSVQTPVQTQQFHQQEQQGYEQRARMTSSRDLRVAHAVDESRFVYDNVASDGLHAPHYASGRVQIRDQQTLGMRQDENARRVVRDDVAQDMVERHYAQLRAMARHFRPDDCGSSEQDGRMSRHVQDSGHRPSYQRAYLEEEERRRSGHNRDQSERFLRMDQTALDFGRASNASDALTDTMLDSSSTSSDPMVSKKARRKEQCRVNQANYRKRKRMYETKLSGQIKLLEDEIQELQARKVALGATATTLVPVTAAHTPPLANCNDPIASIGAFYHALESMPWEAFPLNEHRGQGQLQQLQYPTLQALFDRQQQEFASMESFQWQWLWYREHFDVFHLLVTSSERLDAGDQVIIRISAQLHLQVQQSSVKNEREEEKEEQRRGRGSRDLIDKGRGDWDTKTLVCPVLQQFEFHFVERVLTRITSEIDWIAGVTALVNCPPEYTLVFLDEFIDRIVNRVVV
ncbi:hypothetical protein FI667_g10926, partial [Globisporangium splendens]